MSVLTYGSTVYLFYIPNIDRQNAMKNIALSTLISVNTNITETNYSIVADGVVRVNHDYEEVSKFNYLIVKNNFSNITEWRCFIDDIRYINKHVTEIHYSVDTVSTYIGSATFMDCFVEREHIATDEIGASRTSEPQLTDIVYRTFATTNIGETERITLLFASADWNETNAVVNEYVINGTKFFGYIAVASQDVIQNYCQAGTTDRIIGVYSMPLSYYNRGANSSPFTETYTDVMSIPATFGGYEPKNKKCFQYPLLKMEVITTDGASADFTFEDFDSNVKFRLIADCSPMNDFILLIPDDYKNMGHGAYQCGVSTTGILKQSFGGSVDWTTGDTFQMQSKVAGSLLSLAGSVASGNPITMATSASTNVMGVADSYFNLSKSDVTNQMITGANLFKVLGIPPFRVFGKMALKEIAQIYDSYFEKYGYNVSRIKIPNTTSRNNYNYVKTKGCNVKIRCLDKYLQDFKTRFDNGVTLWNSSTGIGDYDI